MVCKNQQRQEKQITATESIKALQGDKRIGNKLEQQEKNGADSNEGYEAQKNPKSWSTHSSEKLYKFTQPALTDRFVGRK